jgi:hypothetical protein
MRSTIPQALQLALLTFSFIFATRSAVAESPLRGNAEWVYQRAQQSQWFGHAAKLNPEVVPTTDGRSFAVLWKPPANTADPALPRSQPKHWLVTLHGSFGLAPDDLAFWHRSIRDRDIGIVALQWWIGSGNNSADYYTPEQIYREIDSILQKQGAQPGTVLMHGYSRGAYVAYALAAIDAGRGKRYFSLIAATSGGVAINYPPNRAIVAGGFGERPLKGTHWITAAGGRDADPEHSGIPGMRRTAIWLEEQGATVIDRIEDHAVGHDVLHARLSNVKRILDLFVAPTRKE